MFSQLQSLSPVEWIIAVVAMMLIGVSRTGFRGAAFIAVPVFASAFGAQVSTAVVLIMYITADLVAIQRFSRKVEWSIVFQLMPWAVVGVLAGTAFGIYIDDRFFGIAIATIVAVSLAVSVVRELRGNPVGIRGKRWLSPPLGILGGFSSMVGNAAGPLMTMYLLALGLDKKQFLGTVAWFFFLINAFKLPFHIFVWKTISGPTLMVNAVAIVPILLGTLIGTRLSTIVSERAFRLVSFVLVGAGVVRLLIA